MSRFHGVIHRHWDQEGEAAALLRAPIDHADGRLLERHGFEVLESEMPGRLDAEFVREAALKNEVTLDPFLQRVLVDEWVRLGWPFQQFLAAQGLSSHMWIAARRKGGQ